MNFSRLWILRADGSSQAYEIKDFPVPFGPQGFAWSPASDVIAFMPGGKAFFGTVPEKGVKKKSGKYSGYYDQMGGGGGGVR